jgi:hypothetical protein
VAAAANGQQHIVVYGPSHAVDDVGDPAAQRDRGRFAVDHAVPDAPGAVVRLVLRGNEAIPEFRPQVGDRLCADAPCGSRIRRYRRGHRRLLRKSGTWNGSILANRGGSVY